MDDLILPCIDGDMVNNNQNAGRFNPSKRRLPTPPEASKHLRIKRPHPFVKIKRWKPQNVNSNTIYTNKLDVSSRHDVSFNSKVSSNGLDGKCKIGRPDYQPLVAFHNNKRIISKLPIIKQKHASNNIFQPVGVSAVTNAINKVNRELKSSRIPHLKNNDIHLTRANQSKYVFPRNSNEPHRIQAQLHTLLPKLPSKVKTTTYQNRIVTRLPTMKSQCKESVISKKYFLPTPPLDTRPNRIRKIFKEKPARVRRCVLRKEQDQQSIQENITRIVEPNHSKGSGLIKQSVAINKLIGFKEDELDSSRFIIKDKIVRSDSTHLYRECKLLSHSPNFKAMQFRVGIEGTTKIPLYKGRINHQKRLLSEHPSTKMEKIFNPRQTKCNATTQLEKRQLGDYRLHFDEKHFEMSASDIQAPIDLNRAHFGALLRNGYHENGKKDMIDITKVWHDSSHQLNEASYILGHDIQYDDNDRMKQLPVNLYSSHVLIRRMEEHIIKLSKENDSMKVNQMKTKRDIELLIEEKNELIRITFKRATENMREMEDIKRKYNHLLSQSKVDGFERFDDVEWSNEEDENDTTDITSKGEDHTGSNQLSVDNGNIPYHPYSKFKKSLKNGRNLRYGDRAPFNSPIGASDKYSSIEVDRINTRKIDWSNEEDEDDGDNMASEAEDYTARNEVSVEAEDIVCYKISSSLKNSRNSRYGIRSPFKIPMDVSNTDSACIFDRVDTSKDDKSDEISSKIHFSKTGYVLENKTTDNAYESASCTIDSLQHIIHPAIAFTVGLPDGEHAHKTNNDVIRATCNKEPKSVVEDSMDNASDNGIFGNDVSNSTRQTIPPPVAFTVDLSDAIDADETNNDDIIRARVQREPCYAFEDSDENALCNHGDNVSDDGIDSLRQIIPPPVVFSVDLSDDEDTGEKNDGIICTTADKETGCNLGASIGNILDNNQSTVGGTSDLLRHIIPPPVAFTVDLSDDEDIEETNDDGLGLAVNEQDSNVFQDSMENDINNEATDVDLISHRILTPVAFTVDLSDTVDAQETNDETSVLVRRHSPSVSNILNEMEHKIPIEREMSEHADTFINCFAAENDLRLGLSFRSIME